MSKRRGEAPGQKQKAYRVEKLHSCAAQSVKMSQAETFQHGSVHLEVVRTSIILGKHKGNRIEIRGICGMAGFAISFRCSSVYIMDTGMHLGNELGMENCMDVFLPENQFQIFKEPVTPYTQEI